MKSSVPSVLTFSASDPTSGAGLQADALTLSAMRAHPLTILTGLTAQNTQGVSLFEPFGLNLLSAQLDSLADDGAAPRAIKLGVLGSEGAVEAVLRAHEIWPNAPIVMDPVLASGRGDELGQKGLMQLLNEKLMPITTLVTPNWLEGKALTGKRGVKTVASAFLALGAKAVLLKGEHQRTDDVINRLMTLEGYFSEYPTDRLPHQYHGSGCTLASACAACLAHGLDIKEAVEIALAFTQACLLNAYKVGQGQLIPDRMHLMQHTGEVVNG